MPRVAGASGVAPSVPAPSSFGIPAPGSVIPPGSAPFPADAQLTPSTTSLPGGTPATSTPASFATTAVGIGGPFTPEIPLLANIAGPELTDHGYYVPRDPTQPVPKEPPASVPFDAPGGPSTQGLVPGAPALPDIPELATALSTPRITESASGFYFLDDPNPYVGRPESAPTTGSPDFYFLDRSVPRIPDPHPAFDVNAVRADFPILRERVNGYPLVWFDNAATTQKPQAVIDRLSYFYEHENSNIHRAAHELAARSTDAYEQARDIVARFLGASSGEEIIFVRGATEAINLVAQTWGRKHLREGDEIIISHLEHHANIVPWHLLCSESGAVLKVIPVDDAGCLLMEEYTRLLSDRTKLVSVAHVSNALGTITPVREIVEQAHRAGAKALIDGAQSVPHTRIDVQDIDADFFVFSGHKLYGPTGIGALYGKPDVLEDMPPYQGGGNMIADVTLERSTFQPPPGRFEAGTGNIADAVGLGEAIEYVERIGIENIAEYEHSLLEYATAGLAGVPGLHLVGTAPEKASVMSFVLDGYEPLEVGKALNEKGIAVRAGHHCAQPILRRLGLEATVRPSIAFYNTCAEVDRMIETLHQLAADAGNRQRLKPLRVEPRTRAR